MVESGNVTYDSRNNCNAIIETATNTLVHGCKNTTIPNDVKAIGQRAFYGCNSLISIDLPHNVTAIGGEAFCNCDHLMSVTIQQEIPIAITQYTFSNRTTATLYVPKGCKGKYQEADYWKEFSLIVEYGDELSMSNIEGMPGKQVELPIALTNGQTVVGISFTLRLPQGVEVATDEDGDPICELNSERIGNRQFSTTTMRYEDGSWGFRIAPTSSDATVNGNEGEVITITLYIAKGMADGDYTISLTDNLLSIDRGDHDIQSLPIHDATTKLTVVIGQPTDIKTFQAEYQQSVYDLSGRKTANGQSVNSKSHRGVNILRKGDGTTRKVVVK